MGSDELHGSECTKATNLCWPNVGRGKERRRRRHPHEEDGGWAMAVGLDRAATIGKREGEALGRGKLKSSNLPMSNL
jgi:hypothetical protein